MIFFFYILIFVMPLAKHPLWSRMIGDLTVFKYLGGVCLLYAVFHLAIRRASPPFLRTWQARLFLALFLLATLSYVTKSLRSDLAFSPFLSYLSFLLLFFITLTVVDSLRRFRRVLMVTIGSVAFASLYVIREWQKSHNFYSDFRPGWVVGDANSFAISALLCLPLAFYLMLERRSPWERSFYAGCLVVTLVAVTLGASRGGFLGLVAGFLFLVWKSRQRIRNLALASVLLIPVSLLLPSSPLQRLLHPTWVDTQAVESRTAAWEAGINMIKTHPIFGVGLGNFKPLVRQYQDRATQVEIIAHNTYIEIGAELGLPALLVFLALLFSSYRSLERVRRRAIRSGARLLALAALGIEGGLVGFCVSAFFLSAEYEKFFWLMIFLSMCLPRLAVQVAVERKEAGERLRAVPVHG